MTIEFDTSMFLGEGIETSTFYNKLKRTEVEKKYSNFKKNDYIMLTLFEKSLLRFIAQQKLLSTDQINSIYRSFCDVSPHTLRKKYPRWAEKGLLHRMDKRTKRKRYGFGEEPNYYRIGTRGLQVLFDGLYIDKDEWEGEDIFKYDKVRNISHFSGEQEAVCRTLCKLFGYQIYPDSVRPYALSNSSDMEGNEVAAVIPDWMMKYENKNIYIEYETGSQKATHLQEKFSRYTAYASGHPEEEHILLIALRDLSIHPPIGEMKGERHIASVKDKFLKGCEYRLPDNFQIFIGAISRTHDMLGRHLGMDRAAYLQKVMDTTIASMEKKEKLSMIPMPDDEFYLPEYPKADYADGVFEVLNEHGKVVEHIAVMAAEEGDVRSINRILTFNTILADERQSFKRVRVKLLVVYPTADERMNEVHTVGYNKKVLLTDLETLQNEKQVHSFR